MDTKFKSKMELWLRLQRYRFDHLVPPHLLDRVVASFGGADASTRAFADKLARKLRWRVPFAMQAIEEYRKFVYLGQIADFPVTPPKVIDQVWHEHLLFSRAYREFCSDVLGQDFDHNPELIPVDEQTAAFQSQYAATLALYLNEFNRPAPAQFWGTPKFAGGLDPAIKPVPGKRRDGVDRSSYDGAPLYMMLASTSGSSEGGSHLAHPQFGGGASGGAGGSGTWSDSTSHETDGGSHGGHGDSGSADSSGSGDGGDGGGGCSSGCSSS